MTNREAAEKLGSVNGKSSGSRRFVAQGAGLVHGNRGRTSRRRIGDEVRESVLKAYEEVYYDFNFSHFAECLNEREGIRISRSSVVRILKDEGIRSKRVCGDGRSFTVPDRGRWPRGCCGRLTPRRLNVWQGDGRATLHAYMTMRRGW
ncbi:hypothetical protein RAH42_12900 [Pyramidobacter sp. YE332]|uniref:hypothetical protein n=1 Tax=Pyramidobacter sp. YE332 TaxID=3068894 RepID=UPI00294B2903|nr:hypothetical protein [Pyramidobacter sp. YE332]WOL40016.1 hypothetical protein RAH42_12900 [Pyramidobacter sp. YE332]